MSTALKVPPITMRSRISAEAIQDVVDQIVQQFQPLRVVLFGSYASGQTHPESDVDLLVVMHTPLRESEQAIQILQKINYRFGLDLIVHTPENLAQRLDWGDSFLREITHKGKVMYESTNP